jgi:hypothetical protein
MGHNLIVSTTDQHSMPKLTKLPIEKSSVLMKLRGTVEWDSKSRCYQLLPHYAHLAPNDETRAWLVAREAELAVHLTPAGNDKTRTQITRLGLLMGHKDHGDRTAFALVLAGYVSVLAGVPIYGLLTACEEFVSGKVRLADKKWMPTAAEIHAHAMAIAAWAQNELHEIRMILDAKIPPQRESLEHRKLVAAEIRASLGIAPKNPAGGDAKVAC